LTYLYACPEDELLQKNALNAPPIQQSRGGCRRARFRPVYVKTWSSHCEMVSNEEIESVEAEALKTLEQPLATLASAAA
jgi:hypothetical protein